MILVGCKGGGGPGGGSSDGASSAIVSPVDDSRVISVAQNDQTLLSVSPDTNAVNDSNPKNNQGEGIIVPENAVTAQEDRSQPIVPIQVSEVVNPVVSTVVAPVATPVVEPAIVQEPIPESIVQTNSEVIVPEVVADKVPEVVVDKVPEVTAPSIQAEPIVQSPSIDQVVADLTTSDLADIEIAADALNSNQGIVAEAKTVVNLNLGQVELRHHFIRGPVYVDPLTKELISINYSYADIKGAFDYSKFTIHVSNLTKQSNQSKIFKGSSGIIGKIVFSKIDSINNDLIIMTQSPMNFMRISLNTLEEVGVKEIFSIGAHVSNFIEKDGSFCSMIKANDGTNQSRYILFDDKVDHSLYQVPNELLFGQYYCKDKKIFFVNTTKDKKYFSYYNIADSTLVSASGAKTFKNATIANAPSYLTYSQSNLNDPSVEVVALSNKVWSHTSFVNNFAYSVKSGKIRSNDQYVIMQVGSGFYKLNSNGDYKKLGFVFGLVPSLGVVDFAVRSHYLYILTQSRQVWKVDLEKEWTLGNSSSFIKPTVAEMKPDHFSNFQLVATLPAVMAGTKHLFFSVGAEDKVYHAMITIDLKNIVYISNQEGFDSWRTAINTESILGFKLKLASMVDNKMYFIANYVARKSMVLGSFDFENATMLKESQVTNLRRIDRMFNFGDSIYFTSEKSIFNVMDDFTIQPVDKTNNYFFSRGPYLIDKSIWSLDLEYNLWFEK